MRVYASTSGSDLTINLFTPTGVLTANSLGYRFWVTASTMFMAKKECARVYKTEYKPHPVR